MFLSLKALIKSQINWPAGPVILRGRWISPVDQCTTFCVGGPEFNSIPLCEHNWNPSFYLFPFRVALSQALNTRKTEYCWREGGEMRALSASRLLADDYFQQPT